MKLGTVLRKLRKEQNLTQAQLASLSSVAQSVISNAENGSREPALDSLFKICGALGVSIVDFFSCLEQDNHVTGFQFSSSELDLIMKIRQCEPEMQQRVIRACLAFMDNSLPAKQPWSVAPFAKIIKMPVFNDPAAAGHPFDTGSTFEFEEFNAEEVPNGADFAVHISGDSMEPTICNGTIVFVERAIELDDGEIGIFMLNDGSAVCKRLYYNTEVRLLSDNNKYPPIEGSDLNNARVIGRVLLK